jgi:hypothetical protein
MADESLDRAEKSSITDDAFAFIFASLRLILDFQIHILFLNSSLELKRNESVEQFFHVNIFPMRGATFISVAEERVVHTHR